MKSFTLGKQKGNKLQELLRNIKNTRPEKSVITKHSIEKYHIFLKLIS